MHQRTNPAVWGFALVVAGLAPAISAQRVQPPDYCASTMTRPAPHTAGSMAPARILAPPGALAATGNRMLGVDSGLARLVAIDTTTGNGAAVGRVDHRVIARLAYDSNHQILYGSSTFDDVLVGIDPSSGATTVIGPFGVSLMHGLGYDSDNDVLYGITNQSITLGGALWRIDVSTGSAALVGPHSKFGLSGLAYDASSDTMYASEAFEQALYTIDLGSGSVTFVGAFGAGSQLGVGLEFDASLGLFASDNKATPNLDDELYRIDTFTGAVTLVGPIHASNVLGLAFATASIGTEYCTANPNATGSPAHISGSGSARSSAGDLTLTSAPVPNQISIFFHGEDQSLQPFGEGFLCTTGGIVRGSAVMAVGIVASYTYDNSDTEHSLAGFVGSTRNFQHWFRDPLGGGASSNTSNAISIAVLP